MLTEGGLVMIKRSFVFLILVLFVSGCPSAPPAPEPTPVEQPQNDGTAVVTPKKLTPEEIEEVQQEIKAAQDLDAARFAPQALGEAQDGLAKARRLDDEGKYVEARAALAAAKQAALRAQNEAKQGSLANERRRLDDAHNLLLGINADKYTPEEYRNLKAQYDEAISVIESGDLAAAKLKTQAVVRSMIDHRDNLERRIQTVNSLRLDARRNLDEAERNEAAIWSPQEMEQANSAFLRGLSAQRQYNLTQAEDSFTQARYLAQMAQQRVRGGTARERTQALMEATRQAIERASRLTVVDENNNIIPGQSWDSEEALRQRRQNQPPKTEEPQSMILDPKTIAVLEEVGRVTYLTLAKEAWLKGVDEKERGNYAVADDYFREALRLVQLYEALAVDKIYTVRLIPERRDCLWRIAEYPDIYGNALLWPKIWYRNRRLVQNPDLIFPGWQLIIPPQ